MTYYYYYGDDTGPYNIIKVHDGVIIVIIITLRPDLTAATRARVSMTSCDVSLGYFSSLKQS